MSAVAVVTGASRGIGAAVAEALSARGLSVVLCARDAAGLQRTATRCRAVGPEPTVWPLDVTDEQAVGRLAAELRDRDAAPTVLVNNAGIVERDRVHEMSTEAWRRVMAVNLDAAFFMTRALLPLMLPRGRGRIVQVASISATLGTARQAAYCASKWGLVGFTKSLAEELRDTGLQTLTVSPGSTDTAMLVGSGFAPQMQPEDVAGVVVYAALDAPAAMNGSTVDVFGP